MIFSFIIFALLSLVFAPYYFITIYDFGACYTDADPLTKLGKYSGINYNDEHGHKPVSMEDLCHGNYPDYIDINITFVFISMVKLTILVIVLVAMASLLGGLFVVCCAFKRHLKNTHENYVDDLAKIV